MHWQCMYCDVCGKWLNGAKQWNAHIQKKRHRVLKIQKQEAEENGALVSQQEDHEVLVANGQPDAT